MFGFCFLGFQRFLFVVLLVLVLAVVFVAEVFLVEVFQPYTLLSTRIGPPGTWGRVGTWPFLSREPLLHIPSIGPVLGRVAVAVSAAPAAPS